MLLNYNMLKDDEDVFLDDTTLEEVKNKLNVDVRITDGTGEDFINKIMK